MKNEYGLDTAALDRYLSASPPDDIEAISGDHCVMDRATGINYEVRFDCGKAIQVLCIECPNGMSWTLDDKYDHDLSARTMFLAMMRDTFNQWASENAERVQREMKDEARLCDE